MGVPSADETPTKPARKLDVKQIVWFVIGILLVAAIFVFVIPRFANWHDVFAAMRTLTPMEFWSLLAVTLFNLYTYWLANQAALPGLSMKKSAVVTQTGTTVANTLPAGGAVAIGITYAILHSWGFTGTETGLFVGVTGIIGEPMSVQIHARQGHHEREPDGDPFPLLASGYRVAKNRVGAHEATARYAAAVLGSKSRGKDARQLDRMRRNRNRLEYGAWHVGGSTLESDLLHARGIVEAVERALR
jgi:hypothetical protein